MKKQTQGDDSEMYTVKDLAISLQKEKQTIYRAIELLEIYQGKQFQKDGKSYVFNDTEKKMIVEVVKNGIKAAKPTRKYGDTSEVFL